MLFKVESYRDEDALQLYKLFYNTVHHVNRKDYSQDQLNVWAKEVVDLNQWRASFKDKIVWKVVLDQEIIGFGDATKEGYIDRLYVHSQYQGIGVASVILERLEEGLLRDFKITEFEVHASITARPFFEKKGYVFKEENSVYREGIKLTNFLMKKELIA